MCMLKTTVRQVTIGRPYQYRSWPEKESYIFVGSWLCVYSFLVTNEWHIQNTDHPQSGCGAGC